MTSFCKQNEQSQLGQKGKLGMGGKPIGLLIDSPLTYVPFRNITVNAGKKDWSVLGVDFCFSESGVYGCNRQTFLLSITFLC